jgi:hypothetical protein
VIIRGRVRPGVDPELASIDPLAASEWYGYVPDARVEQPSALAAALRGRGSAQLAEIIEAVASDPRRGWLVVRAELLKALREGPLRQQVADCLRLKGGPDQRRGKTGRPQIVSRRGDAADGQWVA